MREREQRGDQAENKAGKPQAVHPLVGARRLEHGVRGSDVHRRQSGHLSALKLNDLDEERDGDAGVVLLERLRCLRDKCRQHGGEEGGLESVSKAK